MSALTAEAHSDAARTWLLGRERRSLVVSDWSVTEFACAIAMKARRGHIGSAHRAAAEGAWAALSSEFTFVSITSRHFQRASELADSAPRGLRAGDALHLAIVLDLGCGLATFDRDLADAARARDIAVHPD